MAWVRIHDGAMGNLKILRLSNSAFRLWIMGLCYCQTHLTDGLIPREALKFLDAKRGDVDQLSSVLVVGKAPLWEQIDGFGFKVHDYLVWNDSKEVITEKRDRARHRANESRTKRARHSARAAHVASGVVLCSDQSIEEKTEESAAAFAEFWEAYPRKVGRASAEREWQKLRPDAALLGQMLGALERQKRTPQWAKDDGQFIPHARTWLHQQRWLDEVTLAKPTTSYQPTAHADYDRWREDCRREHDGTCGNYQAHTIRLLRESEARTA